MIRSVFRPFSRAVVSFFCAAAVLAGGAWASARAAEPTVLGIVAVDGYADLKKQLGWLGGQIGQPGLAAVAESLLMVATQGRGLAGLDVSRPLGVIVTASGPLPLVHGYVPVKNIDKLLESLQGTLGPADRDGDARRVTLPSGATIEFVEKATPNGAWAIASLPGMPATIDDPMPLLERVVGPFSIGVNLFPSAMPEPIRQQLEMILDQAAAAAAAQGQEIDPATVRGFIANLAETESFALGMAIDAAEKQVFVETSSSLVEGSMTAQSMAAAAEGVLTVGTPATAEGRSPMLRGHVVQKLSAEMQAQITKSFDATLEKEADDRLVASLGDAARSLLGAILGAGGVEAAVFMDAGRATAAKPLPEITLGMRIKDGKALEGRLKELFGRRDALPAGIKVAFDTGTAGAATLHTITLDLDGTPAEEKLGGTVDLTLAVSPEFAFVLAGGDVKQRAQEALAASGKPDASAKPIASLQAAVDGVLAYAAASGEGGEAAQAKKAAEAAREAGGGTLEVAVKPIERGVATRLSVDAAGLRAAAAMANGGQPAGPQGGGLVPLPQGFPIPVPVR